MVKKKQHMHTDMSEILSGNAFNFYTENRKCQRSALSSDHINMRVVLNIEISVNLERNFFQFNYSAYENVLPYR